jgi:hypothetical protein
MTAKTRAIPSLHLDYFSAKVPELVAGWLRQVTLTAQTRWPLATILGKFAVGSYLMYICIKS